MIGAPPPCRSARSPWIEARARTLADERQQAVAGRLDRVVGALALLAWAAAIGAAPAVHEAPAALLRPPVAALALVALALAGAPLLLVHLRPGAPITRHVAAAALILGTLALYDLGDGRGEALVLVAGALAIVAAYRDLAVLLVAGGWTALALLLVGGAGAAALPASAGAGGWHVPGEGVALAALVVALAVVCVVGRRELLGLSRLHVELLEGQRERAQMERLAALGHLAATLGAELHPPIAAIRGAEALLRRRLHGGVGPQVDARALELFDVIERELDATEAVLRDLVDFARGREPVLAPASLAAVLGEALEVVRRRVGVDVIVRVDEALPEVEIDRELFRTLLVNLLQNAIEAIPAGRRGRVEVSAEGSDERWWICVEDDGVGVPAHDLHRIFEPLFSTKARGAGLGLPVAAEIVRRHGGTLRVDRGAAGGARFTAEFQRTIERSP